MDSYPIGTNEIVRIDSLIGHKETIATHKRMSTRIVKCASVIDVTEFIGWKMSVPKKGLANISVFGSESICKNDLEWIIENTATVKKKYTGYNINLDCEKLYELVLPVAIKNDTATIGFGSVSNGIDNEEIAMWPTSYSTQFSELIRAYQSTGAEFMAVIGSASDKEKLECRKNTLSTWSGMPGVDDYIGKPVRARFFLRLPSTPSIQLLTILEEAIPGMKLIYHGEMLDDKCSFLYDRPLKNAIVLPDYAVRIMMMEPEVNESIVGIDVCDEKIKPIPASYRNPKNSNVLMIGKAISTSGKNIRVKIGEEDLRRHYQIIGQTGTGKSTLLSTMILSAIEQGYGLTFFDPHGSTIDTVLECVPDKYVDKIRVVRIGDVENPVPLNIWDSDDPKKEERNISDLCELFSDFFDPYRQGYTGPRFERWFSTFAKASIAFLGNRASLESITVLAQNQENRTKLSRALYNKYPELAKIIYDEYIRESSELKTDWNWHVCKFQRITSVEQLRKTLGAGTNALDFNHSIDTDVVTLIDLASPTIGVHASRILGTLLLMKLWNATLSRQKRDMTHMVFIDEASLFQTNPMPRMLSESRKFGLSMVLSHQHIEQLDYEIKEALEANSANLSAFRLSPSDAKSASIRFDNSMLQYGLTRLDAYNAVTTLSVDGKQTRPFTLKTIRPKKQKNAEKISSQIEKASIETLVEPYRYLSAINTEEVLDYLNHPEKLGFKSVDFDDSKSLDNYSSPDWLIEWQRGRGKKIS